VTGPPERVELDDERLDRVDRAFAAQLTSSAGLNLRASLLAGFAAVTVRFLAEFATTWLDDALWDLQDATDTVLQASLVVAVVGLAICLVLALVAAWPRRGWSEKQRERIAALTDGDRARESALALELVEDLRRVNAAKTLLLKLSTLPLTVALLALVVHGAAFVLDAEPTEARREAAEAPRPEPAGLPSAEEQAELAARHAPRVWLHPDETLGPMDPRGFVAASTLGWLDRRDRRAVTRAAPDPRRLGRGCDRAPGGCYAFGGFLARELTRSYTERPGRAPGLPRARGFFLDPASQVRRGDLRDQVRVPVLFELLRTRAELLITYWLFYGHSRPFITAGGGTSRNLLDLAHEGDWENVDVALGAQDGRPVRVFFYGHGSPSTLPWEQVERVGTHPWSSARATATPPTRPWRPGAATRRGSAAPWAARTTSATGAGAGTPGSRASCARRARSRGSASAARGGRPESSPTPRGRSGRHRGSCPTAPTRASSRRRRAADRGAPGVRPGT
jgi:hypothetical protein